MRSPASGTLVALATCFLALLLTPGSWQVPASGLDPSWGYAAEYAYLNGLVFGRDFSFTSGPLSFVYTRLFHPDTFVWVAISIAYVAAVYVVAVWWSPRRWISLALLGWLVLLCAPLWPDAVFFSLPLAIFFLAITEAGPFPVLAFLVAGLAVPSLAKFNVLVMALPLLCLADASALIRRSRCYWYSALYCVSVLIIYRLSGQPITGIWDFLYGSVDVAAGYGQTMGNFWWTPHQTVLVVAAIATLACAWVLMGGTRDFVLRASSVLALAWFIFIAFKTGNVRIGHQATTWHAIAVASSFFVLIPAATARARLFSAIFALVWITGCFLCYQYLVSTINPGAIAQERATQLTAQAMRVAGWLRPHAHFAELEKARREAVQQLLKNAPHDLVGTVASVPWEFSEIIAAGFQFSPTPPLQQYTSYTPRLRKQTEQYFAGARRPENLFFRIATIDEHYRTTELGLALPSILANYDLVSLGSTLPGSPLQLRRRNAARAVETRTVEEKWALMGEWVEVPRLDKGGLMIAIQPVERIMGKLLALLYKQSSFELELKFADGTVDKSRFFPSLVSDGFLVLPPSITEPVLFLDAEHGFDIARMNPLTAIRVRPADLAATGFLPTYRLAASSVVITGQSEYPHPEDAALLALVAGRVLESPDVRLLDGRLLAHTPSKILAALPGGKRLNGEIGFFDGAWKDGNPQPVTFAISAMTPKGPELLIEKTLDPKNRADDRGPQAFSVDLPKPATPGGNVDLLFETRPATAWGWTYWSNFKMMP